MSKTPMHNDKASTGVTSLPDSSEEKPIDPEYGNESPEESARWYMFIAVFWLTSFIKKAAKTPLQFADLFKLHPVFHTKSSTDRIQAAMQRYISLEELHSGDLESEEKDQHSEKLPGGQAEIGHQDSAANHQPDPKKPKLTPRENRIKWALLKGMLYAERKKIAMAIGLHAMHLIAQLMAPIVLAGLLNAPMLSSEAYWMVAALFVCQMFQALCWNNSQYISRGASMSIKAAILSMIYKKALRLGTKGRMRYPTGVIMNLIASDCNVISDSLQYLSDVFVMPFEILSLSILIILFAGPAGAAGLAFMVVCTGASLTISSLAIKFERKALSATDERVKVTGEVINGIKIVKFFAWETAFFERLSMLRDRELKQHIRLRMIGASFSAIMNILPSFVNVITFTVYSSLGNVVDAATIFSTLSIVNLIKLPIAVAPLVLQLSLRVCFSPVCVRRVFIPPLKFRMVWTLFVSLERLAKFFAMEELEDELALLAGHATQLPDANAIVLENASFQWASVFSPDEIAEKEKRLKKDKLMETLVEEEIELVDLQPTSAFKLQEIDLNVKKGSLTVIVGKVGSGKSSLVQAIIGDMLQIGGEVKVCVVVCSSVPIFEFSDLQVLTLISNLFQHSGNFGYSPQAAWLQNQSLRNNILFGASFDEKRYNQVIQCCSLAKDLELLSHGDMSEIGEKGVTLSGGQAARVNLARAVYSDAEILLLDDPLAAVDSHVGRHILEECILGFCRDKTVILVTHQLHIAHHADQIVVLANGSISEQGSYEDLMAADGGFKLLMQEHGRKPTDEEAAEKELEKLNKVDVAHVGDVLKEGDAEGDDLMEEEERITGGVSLKYFTF
ncbi:hypothetical protein HDU98_002468 [Podochytrium sp. JEL0797]|nr:hypothetical protein HDU98_002468 [Podochytrium sp. JEL0797]